MISAHVRRVLDEAERGTGEEHPTGEFHGVLIPPEHASNWDSSEAVNWAVSVLDVVRKD